MKTKLIRKSYWPRLLAEYLDSCRGRTFKWGELDCVAFASGGIKAITGKDYMESIESYDSKEGADFVLEELGVKDVVELADLLLTRVKFPRRGDIVCREFEYGKTLGICAGATDFFINDTLVGVPIDLKDTSIIRWGV